MELNILYNHPDYSEGSDIDVLVLSPHPDDAEICCGGTIAKLSDAGHSVGIVDLSLGEMGSRGSVDERMAEAIDASKELKISIRINMEFPDSKIGVSDKDQQEKNLVGIIRKYRPKTLICPFGDNRNPDHYYSQRLIEDSLFYSNLLKKFPEEGTPFSVPFVCYYMMRQTFTPSFVTDISSFTDVKEKAIKSHKSQVGLSGSGHDTLVSSPMLLSSLSSRDGYFGAMIGVAAAEPFYVRGPISIEDPHNYCLSLKSYKSFFSDR